MVIIDSENGTSNDSDADATVIVTHSPRMEVNIIKGMQNIVGRA